MALRVYGVNEGQPPRMLAEWALAPDADGLFDRRVAVVAGHRYADAASSRARPHGCRSARLPTTTARCGRDSRCRRGSYLTTSRVYMPSERWFVTAHQTS